MLDSKSISSSLIWKFVERFSVQIIQFIVSIVIARILLPEEYGVMAILNIFITICTTIVQSGLAQYLIQKNEVESSDYSTVLLSSVVIAFALYLMLFILSPVIATYFDYRELPMMLRILSLILFITPFTSVQMAYVRRNMLFHKITYASLFAVLSSGICGVVCAVKGAGTWSLIIQQLTYHILTFFVFSFIVRWRFQLCYNWISAKKSFSFGVKLLVADLIDKIYHSIVSVIIGRNFSKSVLAFFDRGKQFPLILIDNIDGSVQSVLYPAYSRLQDNQTEMKALLRKSLRMSTYLSFISMSILFVLSKSLIYILLGSKWMPCAPYMQAYCIIAMLFPFQTTLQQSYIALGKSKLYFNLILYKRLIGVFLLSLVFFLSKSMALIIIVCFVIEILAIIMTVVPARKYLHYNTYELIQDVYQNILISGIIILIGLLLDNLIANYYYSFVIIALFTASVVVILSLITRNESFILICDKFGVSKFLQFSKK